MKKLLCLMVVTYLLFVSLSIAGDLEMYDQNGNYSYGNVERDGSVSIYDQNGNYSYGNVERDGSVSVYDQNGNYSYGNVR